MEKMRGRSLEKAGGLLCKVLYSSSRAGRGGKQGGGGRWEGRRG